jgi:hypothetical protein
MPITTIMFFSLLFGLFGGETAYLNVLTVPAPAGLSSTAPALRSMAGICHVTLTFFDAQGNPVKQTDKWINPGGSISLSLSPINYSSRQLFYGGVQLDSDSDSSCRLSSGLEIDNSSGGIEVLSPLGQTAIPYA